MKVVAALSGGVDSSVMAGLLKLAPDHKGAPTAVQRCCSVDDALDARTVCSRLGIPFYVLDAQEEFAAQVIQPFAESYRAGATPIPCVRCNTHLKFGHLLRRARALGARLAMGHYAQLIPGPHGPELHRPVETARDQTYFLHAIGRDALMDIEFPLGGMEKAVVREHAQRMGLPVFNKPDSQEICFVPDEGHAAFVEKWDGLGPRPGRFLGPDGETLGTHQGVHSFTVGQRKGLGVSATNRLYVLQLDGKTGDVLLGDGEGLLSQGLVAHEGTWLAAPEELDHLFAQIVTVQVRARHQAAPAKVTLMEGGRFMVAFEEPQRSMAPGQSAVVYLGTRCLGGGVIEAAVTPVGGPHKVSHSGLSTAPAH